ncbi:MAG TPA: hypothetical protein VKK79_20865 [Candidatus Lokiarchaeia archaeon]|nr:hypothetical protein [Candidatus Lokiarchaeia archaeon]
MVYFDNFYQEMAYFASIVVGIFSYYVMALMFKRNQEKKSDVVRTLTIVVLFLSSAVIIDPLLFTIFRLYGLQGASWDYATNVQSTFSFGLAGIANAFLVTFLIKVFTEGKYPWYSYIFIILELAILPVGLTLAIIGQDTLPILLVLVVTSLVIYAVQIIAAIRLRRRIKERNDPIAYQGVLYIGISGIFLIATFVSFVLQEVAKQVPDFVTIGLMQGESSIFITLGWIFAGITAYYLYVGYIIPEWIKKRWAKKVLN